ncbi:MAG TPA: hypothetical protein VIU10_03795, partial [Candidatus Udaeobacter sp.]
PRTPAGFGFVQETLALEPAQERAGREDELRDGRGQDMVAAPKPLPHLRQSALPLLLRGLLRVRDSIVDFQPLECRGLFRMQSEFSDLFAEEVAFFRMIVETACLHLFGPAFDFFRRFLFAALIELLDHLLITRALLDLRFEILTLHAFEAEQHVIKRTIEMIFADVPRHERAAFVDGAAKNGVASHSNARSAG